MFWKALGAVGALCIIVVCIAAYVGNGGGGEGVGKQEVDPAHQPEKKFNF